MKYRPFIYSFDNQFLPPVAHQFTTTPMGKYFIYFGITRYMGGTKRNYWVVRLGEGGCFVPSGLKGNYIAIGWNQIGNLTSIKDELSKIKRKYKEVYPEDHQVSVGLNSGQLHTFASKVNKGDIILVPSVSANRNFLEKFQCF